MQEAAKDATHGEGSRPWANAIAVVCAVGVLVLGVLPGWFMEHMK